MMWLKAPRARPGEGGSTIDFSALFDDLGSDLSSDDGTSDEESETDDSKGAQRDGGGGDSTVKNSSTRSARRAAHAASGTVMMTRGRHLFLVGPFQASIIGLYNAIMCCD